MFYVIEGFLDIILPMAESPAENFNDGKFYQSQQHGRPTSSGRTSQQSMSHGVPNAKHGSQYRDDTNFKHLFIVKPGGIAGYLCE
jgi:lysophospholipid hydrolase